MLIHEHNNLIWPYLILVNLVESPRNHPRQSINIEKNHFQNFQNVLVQEVKIQIMMILTIVARITVILMVVVRIAVILMVVVRIAVILMVVVRISVHWIAIV